MIHKRICGRLHFTCHTMKFYWFLGWGWWGITKKPTGYTLDWLGISIGYNIDRRP